MFLGSNIFAAEPLTYPPQGLMVFRGLDDKSSPTAVQDGRATDLQNVKFDTTFALSKRNGYSLVNATLDIPDVDYEAVTGLYYTKLSTGTAYRLATCGDRAYYDNSGIWELVYSEFTTGQNYQFVFETALDDVFLTNDEDVPRKWVLPSDITPVDFSDLSSPITKAKCVVWFRNFLIWGNTYEGAEHPTRIRWSNIGYTETYSDDDYIDIATKGGQEIEAFGILYGNLYIFLTNSIWKLSFVGGDEVFVLSEAVDDVGCIAKNSVQNITLKNAQTGLMFLDDDKKIYFFNGITAQYISLFIEGTMDELQGDRLQYACSLDDGTDYLLCVTTGSSATANNLLLDFEYEIGEWTKHTQIDANAMARVIDSDGDEQSWFGNYNAFVYQLDDPDLDSDVFGTSGTVDSTDSGWFDTSSASGLTIIYDASQSWTASSLTGAIVRITDGTGVGQEKVVVDNTTSGIVVDSAFDTTLDTTSAYSIGDIDAYYQTKWYDFGNAPKRKQYQELFLWAKEEGDMAMTVSYARDFTGIIDTKNISLLGGGLIWGTGIWGTDVWGGYDAKLSRTKLDCTGRYIRLKFAEDDIDETFQLYGFSILYEPRDIY